MLLSKRLLAPAVVGGGGGQLALPASTVLAYSVARAFDGYTGSLFRVRRSSDDAELDIGTDASGDMDEAALLAHTGTGTGDNGFIVKWYEQSGAANAVDMGQSNIVQQHRIVTDGAVIKENGFPVFTSIGDSLIAETWATRPSTATVIQVGRLRSALGSPHALFGGSTTSDFVGVLQSGSGSTVISQNAGTTVHYKNSAFVATNGTDTRGDMWTAFLDQGMLISRSEDVAMSGSVWSNLRTAYAGGAADVEQSEFIVLDSPSAGDISDIEDNQTSYYGI